MPVERVIELRCGRCSRKHGKKDARATHVVRRHIVLMIEEEAELVADAGGPAELKKAKAVTLIDVDDGCPKCIHRVQRFAATFNKAYPEGRVTRKRKDKEPQASLPGLAEPADLPPGDEVREERGAADHA